LTLMDWPAITEFNPSNVLVGWVESSEPTKID